MKKTSKIIIDGVAYNAKYDKESSTLYYKVKEPLKEKFHVATFEVSDNKGGISRRKTRIFHIKDFNFLKEWFLKYVYQFKYSLLCRLCFKNTKLYSLSTLKSSILI